jgi:hypothetical protein
MALHIAGTVEITNTETGETTKSFAIDITDATSEDFERLFGAGILDPVDVIDDAAERCGHANHKTAAHPFHPGIVPVYPEDDPIDDLDFAMIEPHAERPREEAVRSRIVGAEREGDFDLANELDAELPSELQPGDFVIITKKSMSHRGTACEVLSADGHELELFDGIGNLYGSTRFVERISAEEFHTRKYLGGMVAAGHDITKPAEDDAITVDEAIAWLKGFTDDTPRTLFIRRGTTWSGLTAVL